jgi:SOS-response transcriptional repressor LexA
MRKLQTHSSGKRLHFGKTEAVYTYLRDYIEQEGYPPSIRDIAQGCAMGRTTVIYHLHRLTQLGMIRRASGRARSIRLVEGEHQAPSASQLAVAAATQESE